MAAVSREPGRGRVAILAGAGNLPTHVARAIRSAGEDPFIIALSDEADGDWASFQHERIGTGDFAAVERIVRVNSIDRLILSGSVKRRPEWREIRPTWKTLARMPSVVRTLLRGGDDQVLRMVIALIEGAGARVIGAHEVAPDLVATHGSLTSIEPDAASKRDIAAGREAALALGRLDVGQAAVAIGGRVVALEGVEGTDEMLARVADLRGRGRLSTSRKGVLVKFCKPDQDERADLPTIGAGTVKGLIEAGLAGVAVEAGRSLLLEREAAIAAADQAGIFIAGVTRED